MQKRSNNKSVEKEKSAPVVVLAQSSCGLLYLGSRGSGVTKQLGALSNLATQGPPKAADRSEKVCQISNIKTVFLSAKPTGA